MARPKRPSSIAALSKTPREHVEREPLQLAFADADTRMTGDIEASDAEDAAPVPLFGPTHLPGPVIDTKPSDAAS